MLIKLVTVSIIPILLLAILIAIFKQQYDQAGEPLLIFPKSKQRWFILLGLGTIFIITIISTQNALIIGGLSGVIANLWLQLVCPIELREHGIMISGFLVRWSRIQSYEWQEGQSPEHLLLKFKSRNWKKRWKIKISSAKRSQVDQILQDKLVKV